MVVFGDAFLSQMLAESSAHHPLGRLLVSPEGAQGSGCCVWAPGICHTLHGVVEGWVSGWKHILHVFSHQQAMFYNIFNSHSTFLGLSGGWDLALEWSCLSQKEWDCWLFDQPFCLFGLCPGKLGERPMRTGALVNFFSLFPISGKRRGMWPTNIGLDLRIWSSASPALWHSQPWSAAPMATPTHPRSVTFVFFVINNTPCLLIPTSLSARTGTAM